MRSRTPWTPTGRRWGGRATAAGRGVRCCSTARRTAACGASSPAAAGSTGGRAGTAGTRSRRPAGAGRDGEPARALLLYRAQDVGLRRFFAGGGRVDEEQIEDVAKALDAAGGPVQPTELRDETDLSESKLTTAVGRLEDVGAVEVLPSGEVAAAGDVDEVVELVEEAAQVQEDREAFDRSDRKSTRL